MGALRSRGWQLRPCNVRRRVGELPCLAAGDNRPLTGDVLEPRIRTPQTRAKPKEVGKSIRQWLWQIQQPTELCEPPDAFPGSNLSSLPSMTPKSRLKT